MSSIKGSPKKNTKDQLGWKVKEPTVLPNRPMVAGRVDLTPSQYDDLITQKGIRVKVYRSMFCPNVKSLSGEHNIDCTICNGEGFMDIYPIETLAFIQSQDYKRMPLAEGQVDGNSVSATFLIGIELQYFTKVELMDFSEIFFERVQRQLGSSIDVLKYPALRVNALVDQTGKHYYEAIDFCLDPNGNIKWHDGKAPFGTTIYSIHYEAKIQFRAIQAMHVNRFTQISTKNEGSEVHIKLPEQWLLQKDYLVKRTDVNGNEIAPNKIFDPEVTEE